MSEALAERETKATIDGAVMERLAQAVYREVRRWSEAGHIRYHLSWEDAPPDRRERMRDVVRAVLREVVRLETEMER